MRFLQLFSSLESGESVTPSKGADSGVGGLSGEEDSWISDTEVLSFYVKLGNSIMTL